MGTPRQVITGCTEQLHRYWWHAPPCALALERGDGLGMRQKECGLLPNQGQQFIQIVWRRSTIARADAHGRIDGMNQSEFLAVDQLPFLAFLDPFDRQSHLLFELIIGPLYKSLTRVWTRTTVCTAESEYSRGLAE